MVFNLSRDNVLWEIILVFENIRDHSFNLVNQIDFLVLNVSSKLIFNFIVACRRFSNHVI